jgi:hypothetical protein
MYQFIVLEYLRQLVDLYVADAVDDDRVLVLIFAADPVVVDLLDFVDLRLVEVVL